MIIEVNKWCFEFSDMGDIVKAVYSPAYKSGDKSILAPFKIYVFLKGFLKELPEEIIIESSIFKFNWGMA